MNGEKNVVTTPRGFIGSGANNLVVGAGANGGVVAGINNRVFALNGFIGSGVCNIVTPGSDHSAILGGSGNTTNGLPWAGVFGQNVAAVTACALHSNNFVAQDMPDQTVGLTCPTGTLYFCNTTNAVYRVP